MAKTTEAPAPAVESADDKKAKAKALGKLTPDEIRDRNIEESRKRLEDEKKAKAKRFEAASTVLKSMAKDYEDKLGGLIVPFKDSAGKEWPAIVVGLDEKWDKNEKRVVTSARVLVISGRTMQPILADLVLDTEKEG